MRRPTDIVPYLALLYASDHAYIVVMIIAPTPFILALGDSLTAGYGLDPSTSFAARLQSLLRERMPGATVHNAGVSGDTTEGALRRLPRLLAGLQQRPDLVIVELGANDLLRGVAAERIRANLDCILLELGRCGLRSLLATFEPPPFLARYAGIYAEVAAQHDVRAAPFFPAGVLGHPEMVLADRVHPNARAIELVAVGFLPAVLDVLAEGQVEAP